MHPGSNIKKIFTLILVTAVLFCMSSPARAEDKTGGFNFNETTGLINIPNARCNDYKTLKLSVRLAKIGSYPAYKNKTDDPSGGGPATGTVWDSDWWFYNDGDRRLLISPIKNVEFNFMNIRSQHLNPIVACKIVALNETKSLPAIAVGVNNAFGEEDDLATGQLKVENSKAAPFIVASKSFGSDGIVDLTVGYGGGRFKNRLFYGGEIFMDTKHLLSAVGEYDGRIFSYGLKYRLPGNRWDFGAFIQDKNKFGATFNYNIPW